MGVAGEFLATDPKPTWAEDERLATFKTCLDLINNVHIRDLVSYMLSKSEAFWVAPVSNFADSSYPPDEFETGGLVRNTKRAVRSFWFLHHCMDFTVDEFYCGIAALLLRNVTKAVYLGADHKTLAHDPFYLYTVEGFLQEITEDTVNNYEDNGRVLGVEEAHIDLIMRLIRTSDGTMTIIPETFPISPLEKTVHMATLMGRACYELLLGVPDESDDG